MGEYPVLLDGKTAGKLWVSDEGERLLFDAFCPGTAALIRLSAYGGGAELYLGVMQPKGGGLRLRKTVRRRDLPFPPETLTHAARQGEAAEADLAAQSGVGTGHALAPTPLGCSGRKSTAAPSAPFPGISALPGWERSFRGGPSGRTVPIFKIGKIRRP